MAAGRIAQDGHAEGVMEGSGGDRQAEVFLQQAEHCRDYLRSPLYAELCERCAREPLVAAVAPDLRWDLALRLLAALHYLALAGRAPDLAHAYANGGEAWPAFRAALEAEQEFVARFLREQPVQTNEVQRCTGLMLGFLLLARESGRRLDLVELGPSAGLNLLWDRYRYRLGAAEWGPEVRVNCISPGLIRTEGAMTAVFQGSEELVERAGSTTAVGRVGEPADIAHACHYLLSDAASYVSGAVLVVDGGPTEGPTQRILRSLAG